MRAKFEAVERIVLKLQSQEAKGRRAASFIFTERPSTGLEATGEERGAEHGRKKHAETFYCFCLSLITEIINTCKNLP